MTRGTAFWLGYSLRYAGCGQRDQATNRADGVAIEQGQGNLIEQNTIEGTGGNSGSPVGSRSQRTRPIGVAFPSNLENSRQHHSQRGGSR